MNMTPLNIGLSLMLFGLSAGAQPLAVKTVENGRTKTYIVQLTDAPAAVYAGGVTGLTASRGQPGARFDSSSATARRYGAYLDQRRAAVLARLGAVPVLHTYSTSYFGFSARLTDAQAKALRTQREVVSVIESKIVKMSTTRTPEFLGLSGPGGLWSQLDASSRPVKGENIVIGVIDSGIWPEDASFGDRLDASGKPVPYYGNGTPVYGAPPAHWRGTCRTGPGFTPAMCNNKLIGARHYVDGYVASGTALSSMEYRSPRSSTVSGGGHGTHTASTAGGNANVSVSIDGIPAGVMSGIAPRARIAAYKACWEAQDPAQSGCSSADIIKAIDDAVADGVDVINFSVSGTLNRFNDPTEIAFYNAAAAGVFVAAAAGNSGPGNTVAHPSPWLMTVAASTHDRYTVAPVQLGNGSSFSGPSFQQTGLPSAPLVLASNAGVRPFAELSLADQTALKRCYSAGDRATYGGTAAAAIDPAKVQGRIVVCLRGGNFLVDKAASVKAAGGVGMVLQNAPDTADTVFNQPYVIPSVHLTAAAYPAVTAYGATAGATASFGPGVQQANVVAPVMAGFSSRGPSFGNADILKPEITAPGVDIIAAWSDSSLTQAQHDAVANNALTPGANGAAIQGTSMATPHVAGVAALLKQLHPTWSPAAMRSALMTSAGPVFQSNGQTDPARFGYGAGHLNPNRAADPGLVYDATTADFARFLCGVDLIPPPGSGDCATLGSIKGYELNLASLSASRVLGTQTLTRRVTNVGPATSTYVATATLPGWNATVSPSSLTLAPGSSASFKVTLTPLSVAAAANDWAFGSLVWSDGTRQVTSPLSAKAGPFTMPALVTDTRSAGRGTKVFQITSNYTGAMTAQTSGLLPATVVSGELPDVAGGCAEVAIPAGTPQASFGMFQKDIVEVGTTPSDFYLALLDLDGIPVSYSITAGTSDEFFTVLAPTAGSYYLCALSPANQALGVRVSLHSWVFAPDAVTLPLRAAAPTTAYVGNSSSISAGWSVTPGQRYVGAIKLVNPASEALGQTMLLVDTK